MVQLTLPQNARMTTGKTWGGLARARVARRKNTSSSAAVSVRTVMIDCGSVAARALRTRSSPSRRGIWVAEMHSAGPSPARLAVVLLVAALGGCAGEKKVADARPAEPAPPPTAANAYGLMGCWGWSELRPNTPLGRSTVEECFGPDGRGNFFALDYDDGWGGSFGYRASADGKLQFLNSSTRVTERTCRFKISENYLEIFDCDPTTHPRRYENECYDVVVGDGEVLCRSVLEEIQSRKK